MATKWETQGATAIGEGLKVNSSLLELDLGGNRVGDSGVTVMGEGLKVNSSLLELHLGSN